ncbi:MAG TPA: ribose 5-phosphate isomerase B [Clostridiales bacterium]|nr:ribose 5-phosphate isomerase B [Clostridiales bacterium]
MRIAVGCDHGGIVLKPAVLDYLGKKGVEFVDFGTFDTVSVDYPVYAKKVAEAVASGECEKGILLCGTGIGMSIAANKVKGIRAAVLSDEFSAAACSAHNNANILCLGGRVVSPEKAVKLVDLWLTTPFEGDRHNRRLAIIAEMDERK